MSEKIDFVGLIEKNPLTKLNGNYQSSMIDKIKDNFTTYEQQMFISSFYCYLNNDDKCDFVIDLDDVWKWIGFTQKLNAKILLEKHFTLNIDYKKSQIAKQATMKGGQNKEVFLLNINTFKRFCLKAGTKKADEIHEYYIKMEKVLQDVLMDECRALTEQVKKIQTDNEQKDQEIINRDAEIAKREAEYQAKLKKQKELEREKVLLTQFSVCIPIVYIIRVKTHENGEYIVKIGESRRGILQRYNEHKSHYPECVLLDVFTAIQSKDFEVYIHNHQKIRCNRVRDFPGHENEIELFLIGKNLTYQILLDIINAQVDNFQEHNTKKLELEIEKLKLLATNSNNPVILEILESNKRHEQSNKQLHAQVNKLETMLNKLLETNAPAARTQTGFQNPLPTLGPRVQKINPDTLQLIKVYESATEVMTEDRSIKRPSLSKAVAENTVYNGFRWLFVERDMDQNVLHNLQPTDPTTAKNKGYFAKLNADQTEILNVYLDKKTAALVNGYSDGGLDSAVQKGAISRGFYYKLYSTCDETLVEKFEEKYGKEVFLYKDGFGIFDATTGKLVREFKCKYDCIVAQKMSDKTIEKSMRENKPYNGLKFGPIPPRVSCYP